MLPINPMSLIGQMNPMELIQKFSSSANAGKGDASSNQLNPTDLLGKLNSSSNAGKADKVDPGEMTPNQKKLKNACMEFEAVMVSMIMKEGMNGAEEMGKVSGVEEEKDNGSRTFKELAQEQMSYHIGKTGVLGIGELLYQKVKDRLQE